MLLHCVRHGESTFNSEGRIQGHLDIPLSELGRRQSAATAEVLARHPIERVYASPLRRARETAEIIAAQLGVAIDFDERLKEIRVGIFQGKRQDELSHLYPVEFARWRSGDPDFIIPGGESRNQLTRRGRDVLEAIGRRPHREVVVVAHGRLLILTLRALLPGVPDVRAVSGLENGSITTLAIEQGHAQLLAFNRVDHLSGVGLSGRGDL